MVPIHPGQLRSRTAEGLFFELATILQKLESTEEYNSDKKNLVNIQINTDTGVAQITANIIVENRVSTQGNSTFIAKPYLKHSSRPDEPVPTEFYSQSEVFNP